MSIQIHDDGTCSMVDIKKTAKGFSLNRRALHVHHSIKTPSITLASTASVEQMRSNSIPVFSFQLPPPLNAYIYPNPIYAIRTTDGGAIEGMTVADFESICGNLGALALKPQETAAVYDVPAVPLTFGEEEAFEEDDDFENENIDDENESDNNDDEDEEDDDWQDEDDDIGSTV